MMEYLIGTVILVGILYYIYSVIQKHNRLEEAKYKAFEKYWLEKKSGQDREQGE